MPFIGILFFYMKLELSFNKKQIIDYIFNTIGSDNTYLVGGFVRDSLLKRESFDLDFCTAKDGKKIHSLFPSATYFEKYGNSSFKIDKYHITITPLRKDIDYVDHRHPTRIQLVDTIEEDFLRRDFTINAIYMDNEYNLFDPCGSSFTDMNEKIISIIGDPLIRINEDPLRILRAFRFSYSLSFSIEEKNKEVILSSLSLLEYLNPSKMQEELMKCPKIHRKEMFDILSLEKYGIVLK